MFNDVRGMDASEVLNTLSTLGKEASIYLGGDQLEGY